MTVAADIASILTAVVAVLFFLGRIGSRVDRASRLLNYLQNLQKKTPNKTMRSVTHLMARLGMSEEQIFQAAFDKKTEIFRGIRAGGPDDPIARDILFEYNPEKATKQDDLT